MQYTDYGLFLCFKIETPICGWQCQTNCTESIETWAGMTGYRNRLKAVMMESLEIDHWNDKE